MVRETQQSDASLSFFQSFKNSKILLFAVILTLGFLMHVYYLLILVSAWSTSVTDSDFYFALEALGSIAVSYLVIIGILLKVRLTNYIIPASIVGIILVPVVYVVCTINAGDFIQILVVPALFLLILGPEVVSALLYTTILRELRREIQGVRYYLTAAFMGLFWPIVSFIASMLFVPLLKIFGVH